VQALQRKQARLRPRRPTKNSHPLLSLGLLELVPRVSPRLHRPDHLAPLAAEVERSLDETVELCFSVPPRHGKTTLLVHAIVWLLLRDPTINILYVSYAHGFAAKQVRKAMRLAEAAGIVIGDTRRRDEWTTAAGGCVKAAGVGGQITGEGFRVVFVDDPHKNRAEAESRTVREKVVEGFLDDIYTRQDPRGTSFFVVHTRWHERDLIGELVKPLDDDEAKPFRLITLPAIDGQGRALAPRLFDVTKLRKLEARVGPYSWASLYQGSPRPRGGALFADTVLFDALDEVGEFSEAIGVDLAHRARTRSDFNCAVRLRMYHATGRVVVMDVARMQGVLSDRLVDGAVDPGFARRLAAMQAAAPGARTVMYTGGAEELVLDLLARLRENACYVEAWPSGSRDKWLRAQPYAAAWNARRVLVPRDARWASDFALEHAAFTGIEGDRDDQVDAAAAAFDALTSGAGVQVDSGSRSPYRGEVEASPVRRPLRKRWT